MEIEKKNADYLSNYARYIDTKNYTEEYLERARKEIPTIAEVLHYELVKDGRLGACVDISMGLSKMLEKEGYWNYIVKGALTITFPQNSKIESQYFWPIDVSNASAGHVWVVAPPFSVIDISLKQQPYPKDIPGHLPNYVITETLVVGDVQVQDILAPEVRVLLKGEGVRPNRMLETVNPDLLIKTKIFPPRVENFNGITLKYITCAITAVDGELEQMKNLRLNGLYSPEIYFQKIRPRIEECRSI